MRRAYRINWSFTPSEAFDAIVFMNAISQDGFYARHYPSLRAEWERKLGARGLECIDHRSFSSSALCGLLHYVGVRTLDDVIECLKNFAATRAAIERALDEETFLPESSRADKLGVLETVDSKRDTQLCVHETLHGFPGAAEAIAQQDKLRTDPRFESQYQELLTRWKSGPEEYLVTGAEAYLTEDLGLRTNEQCINYLDRQNGGMPLSKALYLRLRERKPDLLPDWQGFGAWVTSELAEGRIRPPAAQESDAGA